MMLVTVELLAFCGVLPPRNVTYVPFIFDTGSPRSYLCVRTVSKLKGRQFDLPPVQSGQSVVYNVQIAGFAVKALISAPGTAYAGINRLGMDVLLSSRQLSMHLYAIALHCALDGPWTAGQATSPVPSPSKSRKRKARSSSEKKSKKQKKSKKH